MRVAKLTDARPVGPVRSAAMVAVVLGIAALAAGMLVVRGGTVSAVEESVFRAVNRDSRVRCR